MEKDKKEQSTGSKKVAVNQLQQQWEKMKREQLTGGRNIAIN